MSGAAWPLHQPLLADRTLVLHADAATEAQVRHWLPRLPELGEAPSKASIAVARRQALPDPPRAQPALALGPVHTWIAAETDRVELHAPDGAVASVIDLSSLDAEIGVAPYAARAHPRHPAIFSALTLASALLLNRMRRALVHAAAAVAPDGRAWLLVGDTFAGKTTTTVNLISSGWDYLSDDHVVLSRAPDGAVTVEGWPRAFHLDHGYDAGVSLGERGVVEPATFGPGRWRRSAPLGGVLFPTVAADLPTEAVTIAAADALTRLIRQSPWLLADRSVVCDVLSLLQEAASRPAFRLRLGRDSYRDADRLLIALHPAIGPV